jgi:hypothetical protein
MTATGRAILRPLRDAIDPQAAIALAVIAAALAVGALLTTLTPIGFSVMAATLVLALAFAALRWPRGVLVLMVLAPK